MKIAVIGAGKLGLTITEALLGGGNEITLIDKDAEVLQKAETKMDLLTVTSNAKNPEVLRELRIGSYDYVIAVTDQDEKNMAICRFAKEMGCSRTIARIRDPEYVNELNFIKKTFYIDMTVNPDLSMANEIHRYLVQKYNLSDGLFASGKIAIIQFTAEKMPSICNKKLKEVGPTLGMALIVAISRNGKIIIPNGETEILPTDDIYMLGMEGPVRAFSELVREKRTKISAKKVMIAGGGKAGFYLADSLSKEGFFVKIIDSNRERCEYLSEHLDNVLVLCGDATDVNLLEEEDIDGMDAFVTLTGFDEENLLLAMLAHERNVEDVVAKVSRKSYGDLVKRLGISMALSPTDITVSHILRFMQGSRRIIFSKLIQGQAEFVELVADKKMDILNTPLSQISLPENVLIAAIHRGDEIIIPRGGTEIKAGDHVIVFCLLSQLPALEKLFRSKKRGL
ncbi:MAG: Trk system potassium transporter TrkA [Clostridiales bacterium]|nr:Trk system potassium transporter TrkA [Clostridiales bacterium]